jgi:hypothetical protein
MIELLLMKYYGMHGALQIDEVTFEELTKSSRKDKGLLTHG